MTTSSSSPEGRPTAPVVGVKESLVTIDVSQTPVMKNEVGYILVGDERLKAEVLRIQGDVADMQVFEDTSGVRVGDLVELSGEMLAVSLGPGLLGQVFDGLQTPLAVLARDHGFFLPRGAMVEPLDQEKKWSFEPRASVGSTLSAGQCFGVTQEGPFEHKIMIPFDVPEPVELTWVASAGSHDVSEPVARIRRPGGEERELCMQQRWPVRRSTSEGMLRRRTAERLYPSEPVTTSQRIIDTFLPIALGGTGCIPGPFGAGKTVLQSAIARHSTIDICIIIACGERAGEVVETINEYPETQDPRTGGSLMDRTIIICNTSSMPVAARESSIYTGITLAEYYRQMGYHVLCIADSTSRWAQAMRETSGRMEEIPGEEAFPAYLESSIKNVYERAGLIRTPDDQIGSVTLIGTVSPAGGNFEEPVTQATLATVKCFLGLSSDRAYKRFYPAIDPLISWSRYLDQLEGWFKENLGDDWVPSVKELHDLLFRGDAVQRMMQVTGEEGISLEDYVTWQKSVLLDMVYLQQDAFDDVDAAMPRERQIESFRLVKSMIDSDFDFADRDAARDFFTRITGLYKNWNYAAPESPDYARYLDEMRKLADERRVGGGEEKSPEAPTDDAGSATEEAAPVPAGERTT
ncbi:MAG: V-type ATP synthase subunit A [Myxococcota bacterium]|nr:V-type ATP synthase subunit A [Myxococcota bacterium]